MMDEILILWKGCILKSSSVFGMTAIRCALTCVSCDLPATRKVCGFKSFSSLHGCSKCFKEFPCDRFGTKCDYSGYNRDDWQNTTHEEHLLHVSEVMCQQIQLVNEMNLKRNMELVNGGRPVSRYKHCGRVVSPTLLPDL